MMREMMVCLEVLLCMIVSIGSRIDYDSRVWLLLTLKEQRMHVSYEDGHLTS